MDSGIISDMVKAGRWVQRCAVGKRGSWRMRRRALWIQKSFGVDASQKVASSKSSALVCARAERLRGIW